MRWGVDASDMKPDIYTVLDTVLNGTEKSADKDSLHVLSGA